MYWLQARRCYHRQRALPEPMAQLLKTPLPKQNADYRTCNYLAVDLETTGLNAAEGEIASIGWVEINQAAIELPSARHIRLRTENSVGQSAAIHQLRDAELAGGCSPQQALDTLLSCAAGRVLVFHHAPLDLAFLNRASRHVYGVSLLLPTIDTLQLEKKRLQRRGHIIKPNDLKLYQCRRRYQLPDYPAHNALTDALATAELFLAWTAHSGEGLKLSHCL